MNKSVKSALAMLRNAFMGNEKMSVLK